MISLRKCVYISNIHFDKARYLGSQKFLVCSQKSACCYYGPVSVERTDIRTGEYKTGLGFHISKHTVQKRGLLFGNSCERFLTVQNNYCSQRRNVSTAEIAKDSGTWGVFEYLSKSAPVGFVKDCVINVHDMSGLPWWATIILVTFTLRATLTFPLAIYQTYILAKVENISFLEMPECAERIKKETDRKVRELKLDVKKASLHYKIAMKKQWDELIVRDNCHPFKASVSLWFQIPTWIFFSTALRNLAYMLPVSDAAAQVAYLELCFGGFLWIPNLTQPDGSLILPVALGLSNLAIIEIQALMRLRKATRFQSIVTNFFRGFSIALIPIAATVPSCVCLYWTTSSLLGLGQNLLLMSNRLRSFCGIPDTPSTFDYPYSQLMAEIKEKFTWKKN